MSSSNNGSLVNSPSRTLSQSDSSFLDDELLAGNNIDDLRDEHENVDKILKLLINYKPIKRPPGRPKSGEKSVSAIPKTVPDNITETAKSLTNINDLHPGILLEYLTKVNSLNKKLLNHCDNLTKKYDQLNEKLNNIEASSVPKNNPQPQLIVTPPTPPSASTSASTATEVPNRQNNHDELQLKLDSLEQKSLSNELVCSGSLVENIIADSVGTSSLTANFIEKVKNFFPIIENENIVKVSQLGNTKKTLKVVCNNTQNKYRILKSIRALKLRNIYFSEYLTSYRNSLYYKLRQLKKQHPSYITAAYTRDGNLHYRTTGDTKFKIIKREGDLKFLESQISGENSEH